MWYDIQTGKFACTKEVGKQGSSNLSAMEEKKNKPMKLDSMTVPTGSKGGVGVILGWRLPSWFIWLLKSRTFFIETAPKYTDGLEIPYVSATFDVCYFKVIKDSKAVVL